MKSPARCLAVPTFGSFITKSRGLLIVRRKKQVIFECPFDEVLCLTIEADGASLSTAVIQECALRGLPIAVCRLSGRPVARMLPARSPLSALLVHRQLAARSARSGTALVMAILTAKLANQRALLLYHSKYRARDAAIRTRLMAAAGAIAEQGRQLEAVANLPMWRARERLFLTEARAAAHYWQAFASLVPDRLEFPMRDRANRVDRRRVPEGEANLSFARSKR